MDELELLVCVFLLFVLVFIILCTILPQNSKVHPCCDHRRRSCNKGKPDPSNNDDHHVDDIHYGPPPIGNLPDHFDVLNVLEADGTSTLVLSCIDYRFVHAVGKVVKKEERVKEYDGFSLAGGSLGYNQSVYPDWPQTWLDHVALARSLHFIHQIILVEHMDCGMYKAVYPAMTPFTERQHHLDNMLAFQTAMASVLPPPALPIRGYLLYLDGSSERLV